MAGPTKKTRKPSENEQASDSASDSESSYHGQQEIQATFEGRNPEGSDFEGIKQLLKQLFLKAHLNLSQLSDMLIGQAGIGSVLKQASNDSDDDEDTDMVEDSDVYGITSVINLTSNKEEPCIKQLYELINDLLSKHVDKNTSENFKRILNDNRIGFLINERFVNIPAAISEPMLNSLFHEIQRMQKKNPMYNFQYYVMICKTCRPKNKNDTEEIYSNDEELLFANAADLKFEFSVEHEADTGLGGKWSSDDKEVIPYRKILLFKADKFESILTQVEGYVH